MKRVHFRGYAHGKRPGWGSTLRPAEVTCHGCVKRLWTEVAFAHFRAFGAGDTEFGRGMRRASREAEARTRGR